MGFFLPASAPVAVVLPEGDMVGVLSDGKGTPGALDAGAAKRIPQYHQEWPMRPLSGLSPEGREEGVGDMDFEVLGRLAACLANEHMAINHRYQQEGDGNLSDRFRDAEDRAFLPA